MAGSATEAAPKTIPLADVLDRPLIRALGAVVILLGLWELIGTFQLLGRSVPPFSAILTGLPARAPLIWSGGKVTAWEALLGGILGYIVGLISASATAFWPKLHGPVLKTFIVINAIPIIAVGPIMMTVTDRSIIPFTFAALPVMFTTVVTVSDGFRSAQKSSVDMFHVFGAQRFGLFMRLLLPSALHSFADALRLGAPAAILGAVLGEWFGSDRGLGVVMVSAMRNVQYELLWTAALATVVLSFAATRIAGLAEQIVNERFGRPTEVLMPVPTMTRAQGYVLGFVLVAIVIVFWQLWITLGNVPYLVAPSPMQVITELVTNAGHYFKASALTVAIAAAGVALGAAVAVSTALIVSAVPLLRALTAPIVVLIPTIPIVVFIPILGSLLGFNLATVMATCVLMAFFPIFALTLAGLAARPPGSDYLFSIYLASRWQRMFLLALPSAVPALLLSLRIAAAQSFLIALTSEWLLGLGGIGRAISRARANLDSAGVWAAVICAILLSVMAYLAAMRLEKWAAAKWS